MMRNTHVTQGPWFVSTMSGMSGTGMNGHRLSVHRYYGTKAADGDHDGRVFQDSATARRFCFEHGYTMPFRDDYAAQKRIHARTLAKLAGDAAAVIRGADSRTALVDGLTPIARQVAETTGQVLARSRWFNGYFTAARALRPDLFKE